LYPGAGGGMAANNHLLNTWLVWLSTRLFGDGEAAIRLPNIAAYAVYLYYTGRFAAGLRHPAVALAAFSGFQGSAYLLDFFCLARGYGLSFALLAGSMVHLQRYFTGRQPSMFHRSLAFAIAAVSANIALLHFAILLFLAPWLANRLERREAGWKDAETTKSLYPRWVKAGALVFFTGMTVYGFVLQRYGALFYGGQQGFFPDTVGSLVDRLAYERPVGLFGKTIIVALFPAVVATGWLVVFSRRNMDGHRHGFLPVTLWVLTGCCLAGVLQHHLFGSLYLIDRSALYLYILFVFAAFSLFDVLSESEKRIWILPAAWAVVMIVHFIRTANLSFVLEWKRDADVPAMLADMDRWRKQYVADVNAIHVGASLEYEQPVNYYIRRDSLAWLHPLDRDDRFLPGMAFYMLDAHDVQTGLGAGLTVLGTYPTGGSTLFLGTSASRPVPAP